MGGWKMMAKLITVFYLISLFSVLFLVYRKALRLEDEQTLNKIWVIFFSGYCLAIFFIHAYALEWANPGLALALYCFCPVVWLLFKLLKKCNYPGDLGLLFLAILFTSLGLVILFRLDIRNDWFLTKFLGIQSPVPVAFKHLFYSLVSLSLVVLGLAWGIFSRMIFKIQSRKEIFIWGGMALTVLALPRLFGFNTWLTEANSVQPSEFAYKILFLIFVAKYYESRSTELVLSHYPFAEVLKLVIFLFLGVVVFFYFPLVFLAREFGTALLIALAFICLSSYVTARFSFFMAGLLLIALTIGAGTFVFPHVEKRVIGAWWDWQAFAFKPFREGDRNHPGYQAFTALSAIKISPWGVGIGNGILKYNGKDQTVVPKAIHDFVAAPLAYELGLAALLFIGLGLLVLLHKALPGNRSLRFPSILAAGAAIALAVQGLYNLSSVFLLLPATGVPLPWISYGGSAVVANYLLIGLLVSIVNPEKRAGHEK